VTTITATGGFTVTGPTTANGNNGAVDVEFNIALLS
jgi:hypothetical protein